MLIVASAAYSFACGGFFCSSTATVTETLDYGIVPVEQNSERILFCVNGDETITTYVEVGYQQNEESDFGWVIPIPVPIDVAGVRTVPADLMNALEEATAPRFQFYYTWTTTYSGGGYGYGGGFGDRERSDEGGCGMCGSGADGGSDTGSFTTAVTDAGNSSGQASATAEAAVVVVAEAVVGPFDIDVITATNAEEFGLWLMDNGYDLPPGALAPLQHYVDLGMAFLGVKLAPEVPEGPIDTLAFTYPGTEPMIPIILTSVASAERLPMIVYVLADQAFVPSSWGQVRDLAPATRPDGAGTNYLSLVEEELDAAGGHAFELEYAGATEDLGPQGQEDLDSFLLTKARLTRWRGSVTPAQMTLDPTFAADPFEPELTYDNVHDITLPYAPGETPTWSAARAPRGSAAPMLWLLGLLGWSRRRLPARFSGLQPG